MLAFQTINDLPKLRVLYEKISEKRGDVGGNGAFASDDTLTLKVRVPRAFCAESAVLRLYRDDDMSVHEYPAKLEAFGDAHDVFSVTLSLDSLCLDGESGLFYHTFVLETVYGTLYSERNGHVTPNLADAVCTQLTVYAKDYTAPARFRGGMMYQIFVDRFHDGGRAISPDAGKLYEPDWENGVPQFAEVPGGAVANNLFFGGNLWGVAQKLDYIVSLGVDTLYLCPIFEAASNHKYDTGDYCKIDRMFGGEAAFEHLIAECHRRGMKLILDGVFNHTGADSRYFNKYGHYQGLGAYHSQKSRYYKWYSFTDYPSKYRCWWDIQILPAVDSTEKSWRSFICGERGIIRRYLSRGIDGWRLDVADELSDVFLDELREAAKAEKRDSLILGEVWEDASNKVAYDSRRRYFRGKQLDSVMNYPLKDALIAFLLTRDCQRLRETAAELWNHYPESVSHVLMNFLGTHDTARILTVLAETGTEHMSNAELSVFRLSPPQMERAKARLKIAWALLATFPGIPCIYYGDEAGMEGGRDPFNRMPFIWGREDADLTAFYRKIGAIRRSLPVFADGTLSMPETGDAGRFLLVRQGGGMTFAAAVNLSARTWEPAFDGEAERLLSDSKGTAVQSGEIEYFLLR